MGFAVGIIITAVGFVLALAVHPDHPGAVDVNTVGWILVVAGLIAFLVDLLFLSSWGPATCVGGHTSTRGPGTAGIPLAAHTRAGAWSRKKKARPRARATDELVHS